MPGLMALERVADLTESDRAALRALTDIVYPAAEWAGWPGYRMEWAAHEWCVRIWDEGSALATHVGMVLRQALHDGRAVRIGGIGGVKTHPAARGRGYAEQGMRRAIDFFHEQADVAFALLLCEPKLLGYYGRLGWDEFGGRLVVTQHGAEGEFTFLRVMVRGIRDAAPPPPKGGTIDLLGPPW